MRYRATFTYVSATPRVAQTVFVSLLPARPTCQVMQRHARQCQQQRLFDELAYADATVGSEHRLELLGHTTHVGLRRDETNLRRSLHTNIHRSQTTLADQARGATERQLRNGDTRRASKMHTTMHLSRHVRELRAQTGKLSERNGKIDVGFGFGQPIDIERL